MMLIKVEFYSESDTSKKYSAKITGHNIITDKDNRLPNCSDEFLNYRWQYSADYEISQKGLGNTRFDYPFNGGYKANNLEGKNHVFAKLSWIQRQKLKYMTGQTWFHLHPVATWTLILNSIFAICNFYFAYQNHKSSINNVETSYLKTITKQLDLQKTQSDQYQKTIDLLIQFQTDNNVKNSTEKGDSINAR